MNWINNHLKTAVSSTVYRKRFLSAAPCGKHFVLTGSRDGEAFAVRRKWSFKGFRLQMDISDKAERERCLALWCKRNKTLWDVLFKEKNQLQGDNTHTHTGFFFFFFSRLILWSFYVLVKCSIRSRRKRLTYFSSTWIFISVRSTDEWFFISSVFLCAAILQPLKYGSERDRERENNMWHDFSPP